MGRFPESGIAAVLDLSKWSPNVRQYLKDVDAMDKADARAEKTALRTANAKEQLFKSLFKNISPLPPSLQAAASSFLNFGKAAEGAEAGVAGLSLSLGSTTVALGVAAAAAAVATAAFVKLGMRGAAMPGVIKAFDVGAAKAGVFSDVLLKDLRKASAGTVSDMQLMKTANLALAGASEEVARALGQGGLAGLMEIARAQAKATGQDVDYLFNSLVTGVKRSTPLLIDNTGLVIKVGEANKKYAESIGKTVDQLTAQERQIALLNATLEAGAGAVEAYGKGSLQASERLAQISTKITNLLDRAAIAVQPLFNFLLAIANTLLALIIAPIRDLLLPIIYQVSNAIFGPLTMAWEGLTAGLRDMFAPILHTVHRWLVLIVGMIRLWGEAFKWLIKQVGKVLGPFKDVIKKYIIEPLAKLLDPASFAKFAGAVFGAFASGILWAANNLIFPAVIGIAEFIRDFLMGFSPPRKGPLKDIDKGGANVMAAWLEGFTGVSLTPVAAMAARVDAELGSIGKLSYKEVQDRLAAMDRALQPFIDHLEIAKAKMKAITTPLKAAQEAIRKRLDQTVKAFLAGEATAAQVRALDRQNEVIARRLGMFEDMTAEAQLQLNIMKARQAVERALLTIQARRTKAQEEAAQKVEKIASKVAKTKGGAGTVTAAAAGGGLSWEDLTQQDPTGSFLGVTDQEIQELWGDLSRNFTEGLDMTGVGAQLATFEQNRQKLSEIFGEIGQTKPFQTLTDTFNSVFGDQPGSVRNIVAGFVDTVTKWFDEDLKGIFDGFSLDTFKTTFLDVFGILPGTVSWLISAFKGVAIGMFDIGGSVTKLFDDFSLDTFKETFNTVFGEEGKLQELLNKGKEFLSGLLKWEEGGTLYDLVKKVADNFESVFLSPIKGALQALLDAFWGVLDWIADQWNSLISQIDKANTYDLLDPFIPDSGIHALKFSLGEPPQLRSGGFVLGGPSIVHRNELLVHSVSPYAVFPARWVSAMERIADTIAVWSPPPALTPAPVVVERQAGMVVNQNFHGRADPTSMRRAVYELQALGVLG